MAEGDDTTSDNFRNKIQVSTNSDDSESEDQVKIDLGINFARNMKTVNALSENYGASGSGLNEAPKREDNPFSFKHFLRSDTTNYQSQGARPKVYCEGRPIASISDLDLRQSTEAKQTRLVPEFSSALPDFVQDHLVIEQSYLGKDIHSSYNLDVNNLPDFAPSRTSLNVNRISLNSSRNLDLRSDSSSNNIPLDLPIRPQVGFPLDLPVVDNQNIDSRSCPPAGEVGVSKSLPDFLADGAVRTQASDEINDHEEQERDVNRLRQELEHSRRQLIEQVRRAENLHRELEIARNKEHEYTQNLAKALEQVEQNLERSNRRAASAENTILKLRQEIKCLTNDISRLQKENRNLRGEDGASGGPHYVGPDLHSQQLAQELRNAANTAEHSLRQLLTGVDNLRVMAASLDNMHRIEERTESFLDLKDDTGPAL